MLLPPSRLRPRQIHQVFGIALIEDREALRQLDATTELPQEAIGRRVECTSPDAAGGILRVAQTGDQRAGSLKHLGSRTPREREQENPRRIGALGYQPCNSMHQGRRLARTRPGDDQQRLHAMTHRRLLRGIELIHQRI